MFRRVAPTARALAVVIGGSLLATCQRDAAGPGGRAALAVGVQFPASTDLAAFNLIVDHARLIVVDPPSQVVFDQTFAFQANDSSIQVTADVPLDQSPQTFAVTVQLLSGGVVLFDGTQDVTVYSGSSNPTAEILVLYTGPGQDVASLTLGPADSVLSFGAGLTFRVTAQDGQGAPVGNFYVSWSTDDAAVSIDPTGRLTALNQRGIVVVTARTPGTPSRPNGVAASTPITFVPVPTTLTVTGCGQSAPPATQLPQPIVAQVNASDGQGVRGVVVTFTAPAGAAVATPQVVTDANGEAQTLVTLGNASGPAIFQVSAPGLTAVQCTQTAVGVVSQLAFTTQPSTTAAGNAITPAVVVAAQDGQGTLVPTYTGDVTIALGANPGGATLSGTKTVTAVGGLATFTDLSLVRASTGYTLQATAASLSPATSAAFDIIAGTATQLAFLADPVTVAAGSAITPSVVVVAQDAFGNVATGFSGSVTVSIDSGPAGAQLSGTVAVSAVGGVATFSNLSLDKAGSYHLRAHATGLTDAISALFDVTVGSSRQLVFTVQPSTTTAGSAIAPAVQVETQDLQGNLDPTFTGLVTVAIQLNPGVGTLSGTTSKNAVAGVATFTDLSIDKIGAGYTLQATASSVTTGVSSPFTVNAASPAVLAFVVPPTTVAVGAQITPAVVVAIHDAFGNLVDTATDVVTVAMNGNPNTTLGGTTSRAAVAGLATFDDLTLDQAGTGYSFVANASGLSTGISPTFDVTAGAASHFVVILSPSQITAGQTVDITVEARDALGNLDPAYAGTVQFTSGDPQATLPPDYTFTAGDNGTHTFPAGATLRTAQTATVTVSDGSIIGSGFTTVLPAAESQLVYLLQPSTVPQNVPMTPGVELVIEDAFGNIVTTTQTQVALRIGNNPGNGTLSGGGPVTPSGGIAIFPSVSIDQPGIGYTLIASAGTLPDLTSIAFDVLPTGAVNTWFGEVSSDWNDPINWANGVPTSTDNVYIPAVFNLPELKSNVTVNDVTVDAGANIETNGFRLTATGNVAVAGQITDTSSAGTGTVELAGAGKTADGYMPNVVVTGTVGVTNFIYAIGNLDIQGSGNLALNGLSAYALGNFSTSGSGTIDINSGGFLEADGNMTFGGGSETGRLKSGTIYVLGDFAQSGNATSFDADYGLLLVFADTGTHTVSFANPGAGTGTSHFGQFEVPNLNMTVSLASSVYAIGELYAFGGGGVLTQINGNGHTLTVKGLAVDSVTIDNMPLVVDSSDVAGIYYFDNVTLQNFSNTAVQLSLTRSTGAYTFNNVTFTTAPNTSGGGLYMRLNDPVVGNGAFAVTMVGASPSGQGTTQNVQVLGEASLTW